MWRYFTNAEGAMKGGNLLWELAAAGRSLEGYNAETR
jgi:hypothetical protein